jgi:large subunit ribosomal protein L14
MIQKESFLEVADNSGAQLLKCIHLHGSTGKRFAYIGDRIKCAVKKATPTGQIKKGEVVDAVIVRTRKEYRREDGTYVRFGENAAVILKDGQPIASRIFGPVARELRTQFPDIASKAPELV